MLLTLLAKKVALERSLGREKFLAAPNRGKFVVKERPMTIRLVAENFRSLRKLDWSPAGVCALVGPNGSGKTTALLLLECLRRALDRDWEAALGAFGSGPVRHLDATPEDVCEIRVELGKLSWMVHPERGVRLYERVRFGEEDLVTRGRGKSEITTSDGTTYQAGDQTALGRAAKADERLARSVLPMYRLVRGSGFHTAYRLDVLREEGSPQSNEARLDANGRNLFAVLRTWRDLSEHEHRWEFIADRAGAMFPNWFRRLDFTSVAQRVSASVVHAKWKEKLAPTDWSDGFFTTLLHLAALASQDAGGLVAIDEPENALHPALIREVVAAMRDWSAEQDVTVLLATHSPVVLDQFREEPEQVFVMEAGRDCLPVPLDVLKKREWLAHYSLGDLYAQLEVGAPPGSSA
ncbi:MAG: AAA family ATPase [Myxococcaceae bacterium]